MEQSLAVKVLYSLIISLTSGAVVLSSGISYDMGVTQKLAVVVDTAAKTFDYYVNDNLAAGKIPFADGKGDSCIINAIQIKCAAYTTEKNSYLTISGVRIYEMEKDTSDARYIDAIGKIESLPDKLTDDPSGVTDNIDLPSGFNWVSGNEAVCGNDGTIMRPEEGVDTYLQTTVSSNEGGYTIPMEFIKRYNFTVAAEVTPTPTPSPSPTPSPTPTPSKKLVGEEMFANKTVDKLENWVAGSTQ